MSGAELTVIRLARTRREPVAQRRVTPDSVVEDLDVLEEARLRLLPRLVVLVVDRLLLQAGEGSLHRGVVPAVPRAAHAACDPVPGEAPPAVLTGVLAPSVRVGHQAPA